MKVDVARIPESQIELTVEVESETVEKYVQRASRSLANRLNIPGFRKGKAPRFVVERMVGKDTLFREGLELLLPVVYKQAVEENDIEPVDRPEWDVVQTEPLVAKAKVAVRPTVQLESYRDIRLSKEEPKVTGEQVQSVLDHMREQQAQWVPVQRPAAMGDRATVDIEASLRGESLLEGVGGGALIQGSGEKLLNTKGTEYLLKPQPDAPFPGLAEEIVGLSAGQEKEFELVLPDSYPEPQQAGKKALFHVKVDAVKEKLSPDMDDEFAKTVGDYSTLTELREGVSKELQQRLDNEAQSRFANAVIQMAVERSTVEIPKVLIEREAERSIVRVAAQLQQQGLSFDQYLKTLGKTREQLLEEAKPGSETRLKNSLVLEAIAHAETLDVSPEEIDEEIDRLTTSAGEQAEKIRGALNSDENLRELRYTLWDRKVVKFLTDLALGADSGETAPASASGPTVEDTANQEA